MRVCEGAIGTDLPNVTNNSDFLLILTPFSKHAEIEHPPGTIFEFNYNICIINDIWYLQSEQDHGRSFYG